VKIRNRLTFPIAIMTAFLVATLSFAQDSTAAKININTATQSDLAGLPGMSKKKADKAIAGRPYSSAADLSKSGLSAKQIRKITPLITFESGPALVGASSPAATPGSAETPVTATTPSVHKSRSSSAAGSSASEGTTAQTPPQPGMVWVSRRSKVYHVQGDRWYGKTKHGEWMTEADAIKAGYRKAK
jgi:Helix-hairpin-helix motif